MRQICGRKDMGSSISAGLEEIRQAYQDFIEGFHALGRLWEEAAQRFPEEWEKAKEAPCKKTGRKRGAAK
jgi:hypothetical protein